jgi:hypothetical protein
LPERCHVGVGGHWQRRPTRETSGLELQERSSISSASRSRANVSSSELLLLFCLNLLLELFHPPAAKCHLVQRCSLPASSLSISPNACNAAATCPRSKIKFFSQSLFRCHTTAMQSFCQPPPEGFKPRRAVLHCNLIPCAGITKECKLALAKFVLDSSASVRVDRGWLICLLSSPPVLVAATASTGDAACDVQLLRGCLPIGLAVSGCWQRDDSTAPLSICTTMWAESGATGACMHLGVTASGELTASMPVVLLPQSRLFSVSFSLAVAKGDCFVRVYRLTYCYLIHTLTCSH